MSAILDTFHIEIVWSFYSDDIAICGSTVLNSGFIVVVCSFHTLAVHEVVSGLILELHNLDYMKCS